MDQILLHRSHVLWRVYRVRLRRLVEEIADREEAICLDDSGSMLATGNANICSYRDP